MPCFYKLPATGSCLAAVKVPTSHVVYDDENSNCYSTALAAPPPHYFLAGTNAANQRGNEVQLIWYNDETCECECSSRILHSAELQALTALTLATTLTEDETHAALMGKKEAATEDSINAEAVEGVRCGGASRNSSGPKTCLCYATAFPDAGARFQTSRCIVWGCEAILAAPTAASADTSSGSYGNKEEEGEDVAAVAPIVSPYKVAELFSSKGSFDSIRKLKVRENHFYESAGSTQLLAVVMKRGFEIFTPAEAAFQAYYSLPASSGTSLESVGFDCHNSNIVIAVESCLDSLNGNESFCSGGRLKLVDMRQKPTAFAGVHNDSSTSLSPTYPHEKNQALFTSTRNTVAESSSSSSTLNSGFTCSASSTDKEPAADSFQASQNTPSAASFTSDAATSANDVCISPPFLNKTLHGSSCAPFFGGSCWSPHGPFAAPLEIDSNPNMPYCLVTSGSDGAVAYWDQRLIQQPVQVLRDLHSHWITTVKFNAFHDQLLLTASTDNTIKLHLSETFNPSTTSGNTHRNFLDANDRKTTRSSETEDGAYQPETVFTYDGNEDSVVAAAWAADDAWAFAALSGEGKLSFHNVPSREKYRILL